VLALYGDEEVVEWARQRAYTHYYCRERGLPDPCLKVHLGQVSAYFHEGQLVRLALQVDGELLDDACAHLRELLAMCEADAAYMVQQPRLEARLTAGHGAYAN
jgi:hypothetical protein